VTTTLKQQQKREEKGKKKRMTNNAPTNLNSNSVQLPSSGAKKVATEVRKSDRSII
jgi:hypothetical protein